MTAGHIGRAGGGPVILPLPKPMRPHSSLIPRRGLPVVFLAALLFAPFQCRKAAGVAVDPMLREAEDALVSYLKIDTSNPPGNETSAAIFLQQTLSRAGIPSRLIGSDPRRQSIYARLESHTNEKALILLHHLDVVPADPSEWTVKPFSGAKNGGYIWGRGALDIKSLGIAELMSFIALKRSNAHLTRDVIFLGVADEEAGGEHGCRELLEQHPELFVNAGFVLNEGGSNETIVDKVGSWGIEVAQKVPLWLRITSRGTAGHGAAPPDDGGSVVHLLDALSSIREIPCPYRVVPSVARYFKAAGAARNDARGEIMRNLEGNIGSERIEKILSPGYRALLRDTIAFTRLSAGTIVNSIPAHATADVDIRLLPDEKVDDMLKKVIDAAGSDARVEVLVRGEPTPESSTDTALYRVLSAALMKAEPGSTVAPMVSPGTSDSRFFRAHGMTAYGFAPFKVNYYDADTVHGPDERIRARFFSDGVKLVRTIVRDFCVADGQR